MLVSLVGFMGAGKSGVGRSLAQRLGWRFIDLDDLVENREARSIADIFAVSGETGFRYAEAQALKELLTAKSLSETSIVLSLGGGAICQPDNLSVLERANTVIVFLSASAQELWQRCVTKQTLGSETRPRPLLKDEASFKQLYEERRPHYERAQITVSTSGKSVDQTAEEVLSALQQGHWLPDATANA
jgi:shikimate kinase